MEEIVGETEQEEAVENIQEEDKQDEGKPYKMSGNEPMQVVGEASYSKTCKVCNYKDRAEIERLHVEGWSNLKIERHCNEVLGLKISGEAIRRHIKNHFESNAALKERLNEVYNLKKGYMAPTSTQLILQAEVERRLADIEILDETVAQDMVLRRLTSQWIYEILTQEPEYTKDGKLIPPKLPMALTALHSATGTNIQTNRRTKAEMAGDIGSNSVNLADVLETAWKNRGKKQEVVEQGD